MMTSKSGTAYHWNDDFVSPFLDTFLPQWKEFFQDKLTWYHWKYFSIMNEALAAFQVGFGDFVTDTCGAYPPIQHILDQIPLQQDRVLRIVHAAWEARREKCSEAPKTLRKSIKDHMSDFYTEGRQESGTGLSMFILTNK